MFENSGKKIQSIATFITVFGIIASICEGIIVWVNIDDEIGALIFLGFVVVGSVASYLLGLFLHAFGGMAEDINYLKKRVYSNDEPNTFAAKQKKETAQAGVVFEKQGNCALCGKQGPVVNAVVRDDLGVRFRDVCEECFEKHNCKKATK